MPPVKKGITLVNLSRKKGTDRSDALRVFLSMDSKKLFLDVTKRGKVSLVLLEGLIDELLQRNESNK